MDSEMIEKVGAAIYESSARTVADTRPEWEALDHVSRNTFKLHARAAITAYESARTPDPAIVKLREALLSARRTFSNLAMIAGDGTAVALQSDAEIGAITEALSPSQQDKRL